MVYIDRRLKELKRIRQIQSRQIKETKQMNESNAIGDDIALFFVLMRPFGHFGAGGKRKRENTLIRLFSLSWATGRLWHPVEKNCAGISWQQPVLPESSSHLHTCTLLHGGSVRGRQQCRCWQSDQLLPYLARS